MPTQTDPVPRTGPLRTLLAAHVPATAEEEAHRDAMLALADAPGDPFDRHRYLPGHFTASAFVLGPSGDELLLIWHSKFLRWLQPGGHVDPDDADIVAAARREVAEEAGVTALAPVGGGLFDLDVHLIPPRKGEPEHRHFDVRLLFQTQDGALAHGSDAGAARWVRLGEIGLANSDESVLRAVRKLQRSGLH
jgi:8-oxo-dGTP pyrophosphatase MutT (NUDIX family)